MIVKMGYRDARDAHGSLKMGCVDHVAGMMMTGKQKSLQTLTPWSFNGYKALLRQYWNAVFPFD